MKEGRPPMRLASVAIVVARGTTVRRLARYVAWISLAASVAVAVTSEAFSRSPFPFFWASVAYLLVAIVAGLAARLLGRLAGGEHAGTIEVADGVVEVRLLGSAAVMRFPVEDLEQGSFCAPGDLVLQVRGKAEIRARVAADDAEALLDRVGLSARQRTLRVPLASVASDRRAGFALGGLCVLGVVGVGFVTFISTILVGVLVLHVFMDGLAATYEGLRRAPFVLGCPALAALGGLGLRALAAFFQPREAVLGTDGVAVGTHARRRFVPYAAMTGVVRSARGVTVALRDGTWWVLPLQGIAAPPLPRVAISDAASAPVDELLERRELLLRRIEDGIEAQARAHAPTVQLDVLDRKSRTLDAWRDALLGLLARPPSYRDAHATPDHLFRIVADAGAAPERRVAAAVALSGARDDEHLVRVRAVARACADDDLRAAIEQAAEGEIEERTLLRMQRRHPA